MARPTQMVIVMNNGIFHLVLQPLTPSLFSFSPG